MPMRCDESGGDALSLRRRVYRTLDVRTRPPEEPALQVFLGVLIMLNVLAIMASTVPTFDRLYHDGLVAFEIVSIAIYTVEIGFRVWSATADPRYSRPVWGRLRFVTRPLQLIDLIAIVPFYLPFLGVDLRFLRMVRLLRVVKFGRYSEGLDRIDDVIVDKRGELASSIVAVGILLVISAMVLYVAEHDAQPGEFSTLPETLWFAVLMSVGDFSHAPVTALGRLAGTAITLVGLALFALPAGIVASGFLERFERERGDAAANRPSAGTPRTRRPEGSRSARTPRRRSR